MKPLHRTLAILAALFLVIQSVRHAYVLWLAPRSSILDRFDHPLKNEIDKARSLEEVARRYEPLRQDVDRIKKQRLEADPKAQFLDEQDAEPFRSERELREAIQGWEQRACEIHALRFYWLIGLIMAAGGLLLWCRNQAWAATTFLTVAFSEMIYWTTPTFLGGGQEFDRLVLNKLALSVLSMAILVLAIRTTRAFGEAVGPEVR
jgi:hypothetical protein